jgi:thioesterase domain-containing protein/acyl carrier protein
MLNCYGPTESTTFATWHEVESVAPAESSVPIGRPLANTTVYVLDANRQLVPVGVPGEIYIGGDGLALGYLNQPRLTDAAFVPDPFVPGARLYRTGDRAKWRSDARIDFLGRADGQVKIRGHRIEPAEIESALFAHPAVRECVVVVDEGPVGARLVAYVARQHGRRDPDSALAAHLRERLPAWMVPDVFVAIDAVPMTVNGKVDRSALPPPGVSAGPAPASAGRPLTTTESRLIRLWQDVLGLPRVGPSDGFFDLGGHSLLAATLFSRIEQEFDVRLPLSELFTHGTVEQLAKVLDGSRGVEPWTPLVPIRPTGSQKPLFIVHGIGGEVLTFAGLALRLPADLPVYGIQAAGPGADREMPVDIDKLGERYAEILLSVDPDGPYYVAGYSSGAVVALEVGRSLQARGRPVALVLALDGGLPAAIKPVRRHTPASLARQMGCWIVDDALSTSIGDWWLRVSSTARSVAARFGLAAGGRRGDIRDQVGMGRYPDNSVALLTERYDAFRRHRPQPYPGRIALIRSRTGSLFGARTDNLDAAWRALAQGPFTVTYVKGSHWNILVEPRVNDLARIVADAVSEARKSMFGDAGRR